MNLYSKLSPQLTSFSKGIFRITIYNTFDLLLGVLAAIAATPLIVSIVFAGVFIPETEWNDFWDEFLEL